MSRYGNPMPASAGDPNCGLCRAQFHERWSSLPEIQDHAEDGCPYCANLLEGLLYLVPDVEARFGEDATFRFQHRRDMTVYADPNGSLKHACPKETISLRYRWFMVDESNQPYEPQGDTSSEDSFAQANAWIQDCLANHKLCGNDEPSALPTRVLDLGDGPADSEPETIRLVETSSGPDQAPATGRYISLSHSWGGEHPLTTTTAVIDQHKAGIPLANLPTTFRDACQIAWRLGIRYLWIDSLCIIQDSPSDWELEASRMSSVYRNSWLTVCATASSSPSSGIFRTRQAVWIAADDPPDAETIDILFPEAAALRTNLRLSLRFAPVHTDFSSYADPTKQKDTLPLLARAWGYQERLLAPRVLHFGPQELFWECMQTLACECGGIRETDNQHMGGYAHRDTTGQLPPKVSHYAALHVGGRGGAGGGKSKIAADKRRKKLLARWQEMVEEYTNRALTFSADRLPAFAGVAAEMVDALGMRYLAGQWQEVLPQALLFERTRVNDVPRLRVDEARPAPSWSWTSVDEPVHFWIPLAGSPEWANPVVHAKVLEVRSVPAGRDERGRVKREESWLMLSAEVVKGELCFSDDHYLVPNKPWTDIRVAVAKGIKGPQPASKQLGKGSFAVRVGKFEPLCFVPDVQLCDEHGEWAWKGEDEICCAKIMESQETWYWLVLRRIDANLEGPIYERIGMVQDYQPVLQSTDKTTTIKII
ncbi:heterokaryon incompatibility protein-domain-containing protein [Staphylotrichum tortipilum]|uniref:Heterokaryon incompatibility protein-domain-containing protein n=1 Tax=Staphylotrichum tortipilum TaxID=2831512 RepID=A0AAN6MNN5_9PEZI|nr:heterokaryon incompatibility protein-domain-containing protein [Staphylotrichum longicolle]